VFKPESMLECSIPSLVGLYISTCCPVLEHVDRQVTFESSLN